MSKAHRSLGILLIVLLGQCSGCASLLSPRWSAPLLAKPDHRLAASENAVRPGGLDLMNAELAYAAAHRALDDDSSECVDQFYQTAKFAWAELEEQVQQTQRCAGRAVELYHSALHSIVREGTHYQRFNPQSGLTVRVDDSWYQVPIHYHGFVRPPEDFTILTSVGEYTTRKLNNVYRWDGLGVPTIATRRRDSGDDFEREQSIFAATLLLRPTADAGTKRSFSLELHDPLRIDSVDVNAVAVPLMRDLSAPMARALETRERNYIRTFLQPGLTTPDEQGLFMLEPYQPGKIPIVFVHGLLSDRLTWANVVNELAARPEFFDRFQLWSFEYPTGEPFLKSAASLRRQMAQLLDRLDPQQSDPALRKIVLVGHSMGGLVSTAQITSSGDYLWNSISKRRFEDTKIPSGYRQRLSESFFFEPSPAVSRVVYIGTPHRGSALAQRLVGRLGSLLVKEPSELTEAHRQLIDNNPDAFTNEFSRRIPTSIDLLEPNSQLLFALRTLPKDSRVQYHSIIGDSCWTPGSGDTDGVVPVSSAQLSGATSERLVDEKHSELPQHPEVIAELLAILQQHLQGDAIH